MKLGVGVYENLFDMGVAAHNCKQWDILNVVMALLWCLAPDERDRNGSLLWVEIESNDPEGWGSDWWGKYDVVYLYYAKAGSDTKRLGIPTWMVRYEEQILAYKRCQKKLRSARSNGSFTILSGEEALRVRRKLFCQFVDFVPREFAEHCAKRLFVETDQLHQKPVLAVFTNLINQMYQILEPAPARSEV